MLLSRLDNGCGRKVLSERFALEELEVKVRSLAEGSNGQGWNREKAGIERGTILLQKI